MKNLTTLSKSFFDKLTLLGENAESDRVCFKKSLEQFLKSGNKEDAFIVYYCFSEVFKLFGNGYDNTQKLLEMLSDHEYHSGELLSKHRDHYCHSVYVFALGLALYNSDEALRKVFIDFYGGNDDGETARRFLYLWGAVSLFHDIGYPFQLAHEQIKNYSIEMWGKDAQNLFVSFGNYDGFTALSEAISQRLQKLLGVNRDFTSLDRLLAYGLNLRMGYDEQAVCEKLKYRVEHQPAFMDHAYFSSVILCKQLLAQPDFAFDVQKLDVMTAILLHNSFNKYDAPGRHPVGLTEHPLAYLLIVCDELQNWDRLAYGKVSKRDPIAWDIAMEIGENSLTAKYYFESCTITDENGLKRFNKSFQEIQSGEFVSKILSYVTGAPEIVAYAEEKHKHKKTNLYASDNNFINLCDFAKAVHASYLEFCKEMKVEDINDSFEKLPLEFKVSNIEQAKSYAYKLELINCFYSSKDLDYPVVTDFKNTEYGLKGHDNLDFLCREEHVRWVREKLNFGWSYGTDYSSREERNAKKIHKDIVPYEVLSESDRQKDEVMINNIIPLLRKFGNNVRIYSYRTGRKPDLVIAGTGHRFFTGDVKRLKERVKQILLKYSDNYRVIVRTCYAYGADLLIAECAEELGITTKAVLPTDYESYVEVVRQDCIANGREFTKKDELKLRHLLALTVVCKTVADPDNFYFGASRYLVNNCDKLIALWDGKQFPVNSGGTYDCIRMAKERGLAENDDIFIIACDR